MTIKFDNVYLGETATNAGPFVKNGPLKYDITFDDFYDEEKSFELCEIKEEIKVIELLLKKMNKKEQNVNLLMSSDLLNQLVVSNYTARNFNIPFFGIYNACASINEEIILMGSLIDSGKIKNGIVSTSSNNMTSERQFRNPVEYGAPKKLYQTFTVTGATALYMSKKKTKIKLDVGTIGKVVDKGIKDASDMGSVMAPSAAQTLYEHLKDTKRTIDYYDLILTGDLGKYGKEIFIDYTKKVYDINLINYDDAATMIYSENDKNAPAGGSGISCLPLVLYSCVFPKMKKKEYKKVLLLATGALMNQTMVNEKNSIPSITHAISLEVI